METLQIFVDMPQVIRGSEALCDTMLCFWELLNNDCPIPVKCENLGFVPSMANFIWGSGKDAQRTRNEDYLHTLPHGLVVTLIMICDGFILFLIDWAEHFPNEHLEAWMVLSSVVEPCIRDIRDCVGSAITRTFTIADWLRQNHKFTAAIEFRA